MKNTLIQLIQNDKSYNKSVTRYLYKTHPELWQQILLATNFLPEDALAKQRVWHILNDIYSRPTCPITGEFLKWLEKKYVAFSSMEAKNKAIGAILSEAIKGDNHWRNKDPEKSQAANEKFSNGFKEGKHKPWDERNRDQEAIVHKGRQTLFEKYGVVNVFQLAEIKEKSKETLLTKYGVTCPNNIPEVKAKRIQREIEKRIASGQVRTLRNIYYSVAWTHTRHSWVESQNKVLTNGLIRSREYTLDHIYSVQQGFRDNIPPYIIGHWSNLRLIPHKENSSKGMRCDKTKEQLFEDFFKVINT